MPKDKHMTSDDRAIIQVRLKQGVSLNEIAKELGKHHSTISREIRKHRLEADKFPPHRLRNRCVHQMECHRVRVCDDKTCGEKRRCSLCNRCNGQCPAFEEQYCHRLDEPPYVCNGCPDDNKCVLRRRYYEFAPAQEAYREMLSEARQGVNLCDEQIAELDEIVTPLIRQGQSVGHICRTNTDILTVSPRSLYRYVNQGLLQAKNMEMPRVVRMKPRKGKQAPRKVDTMCREGRTIEDYRVFRAENDVLTVQMDTVKGGVSGPVLLTLMFENCDFMLAFLRPHNTSATVIERFDWLYETLGAELFKRLFPALLTDNGSEFSNPKAIEFDRDGNRRTRVFYCDPMASWQKPNVENNHEFIRRVLPKGRSFADLSQDDIDLMMSHINSYSRPKMGWKSPLDVFCSLYGNDPAAMLGQRKIPSNEIVLTPDLLKKKS